MPVSGSAAGETVSAAPLASPFQGSRHTQQNSELTILRKEKKNQCEGRPPEKSGTSGLKFIFSLMSNGGFIV